MKKALLLGLTCLALLGCGGANTSTKVNGYKEYTNVGYYYNDDLTYTVEFEDKQYTLSIDNVYWARKFDARIQNKFYIGIDYKLVIYYL